MQNFEHYHPIYTNKFVLDWLTMSKVRDVFELRHNRHIAADSDRDIDETIVDTTGYVNNMMRLVMNNQALIWGISDKHSGEFLGMVAIWDFDHDSAMIRFEILPQHQNKGVMQSVLTRMVLFAFDELHLKKLQARTLPKNKVSVHLLEKAGFSIIKKSDTQYLHFQIEDD